MLDLITKSEVRKKILLLLIYNHQESFYLSQIARFSGVSAGNAKQELLKIKKNGFLLEEKKGNSLYFKINTKNPLFKELKNIVDKTIGIRRMLEQNLRKIEGIEFAFLFGSYVNEDFGPDSDIDLYVVGSVDEDEIYKEVSQVEDVVNREINYHLSSKEEFQEKLKKNFFYKQILENFILLIGEEDEFKKITK